MKADIIIQYNNQPQYICEDKVLLRRERKKVEGKDDIMWITGYNV